VIQPIRRPRVTASAAMDGGVLAWVGEVWAGDVEAWVGEEVWAAWAGEADIAAEIYIKVVDRINPARHFTFQYAGRSRPLPADFCKLDF
jgi:hypothetical protein